VDHCRPICPRPTSLNLRCGCKSSGCSPPPRAPSSPLPWEEWQQGDERHRQQLLDKEAARARQEACAGQEAVRRQQLLDVEAACARRHEAARLQQLLDEQAARKAARARSHEAAHLQQFRDEKAAFASQEAACLQQLLAEQAARARARARQEDDAKDEYEDVAGQFFAHVDATMAKIQAMDDGFENQAAARVKALADALRQAAALEKALADEANERRRADTLKKSLADEAKERHEAAAHAKALAAKVLANKRGGQKSAVRGSPLQTVRRHA
jgi:hypothetical protein